MDYSSSDEYIIDEMVYKGTSISTRNGEFLRHRDM